jgi:hypothetical protein
MLMHRQAIRPAKERGPTPLKRPFNVVVMLFLAALSAGCTTVRSAPIAADPDAPVRAVRYSPVLAGYSSQRPVAPLPWRERNERVTPKGEAQ